MMKSIAGINSWTQELLLKVISPAVEQLLNRNLNCEDPALILGFLRGGGLRVQQIPVPAVKPLCGDDCSTPLK